jgi:hypothetical protein
MHLGDDLNAWARRYGLPHRRCPRPSDPAIPPEPPDAAEQARDLAGGFHALTQLRVRGSAATCALEERGSSATGYAAP